MYYIIERETDLPFDQSIGEIEIQKRIFDVVKGQKNTGLVSISTFIVDDNKILIKSDPRIEAEFKQKFENLTKIKLQELLLG